MTARILLALWTAAAHAQSGEFAAAQAVLEKHCISCHGAAKMSDLDLGSREAILRGGKRGASIVPGKPEESLLYKAVLRQGELQMPPGRNVLPAESAAVLRDWIKAGAPWDNTKVSKASEPAWWAFRKPQRPNVPPGATHPIDGFVMAKLKEKSLRPAPAADRRTLIRRAYFDLHGLPPAPAEVERFASDPDPNAWAKLIDQLLQSPRYGERWGRHWLDVVRYADTGGFETDIHFLNAWRYRDYVIDSFNEDKPYHTFVQEQIAADEIWPDDLELEGAYEIPKTKLANFKKRLGTTMYTIGPVAAEFTFYGDQYRAEWQADAVETTASAFLGLTYGCARCHDHKFDPITQKDYYRMAALFAGSEDREIPMASRMDWIEYTRYLPKKLMVDELAKKVRLLTARVKTRLDGGKLGKKYNPEALEKYFTPEEKDEYESLLRQIGLAHLKSPKPLDTASVLVHSDRVHDTHVLVRGEWKQKGDKVAPGFPAFLNAGPAIVEPDTGRFIPQRRKALAEWLTSPDHPLFARVMVNRIWQGHFGIGLAPTANDFGHQGDAPTHPELLDWLATEFTARNYSVKAMHRLIMLSAAYQRSSRPDAESARIDAENKYLWRMNRRRLEAEAVRDAVLAASGELNLKMYGPPVAVPLTAEELGGMRDLGQWAVSGDPSDFTRRSVYLYVKRSFRLPMFETFDAPDAAASCPRRENSTVAPQALALMNSEFVNEQAGRLAARLKKEHGEDPGAWVDAGWRTALGRAPSPEEKQKAVAFLAKNPLPRLCLMWFNLSEFLYVD
ncbi:MAG: PSD1 and planctomycete cytochrome C domain-containing protein [Bryobacteraceae bacterium]|nr:PSD1 and planctomycete cytochrome C domain-containing protein [Bryobacteraceae bacterium]